MATNRKQGPNRLSAIRLPTFGLVLVAVIGTAACGGAGGGGGGNGQVVQVGNNLDFEPTNLVTCQDGYPIQINPTFPQPFQLQGNQSCLLLTFFPGAQPTAPGRAVSANIRIGQVTGPMRFVRMRILFQRIAGRACCSIEQYGDVFTPNTNSITTVALNFPMTEEHVPPPSDLNTIAANDLVALEVLAPNVPIPGVWIANGGGDLTLPNYLYLPSMSARNMPAPSPGAMASEGSYSGFLPSFNLNYRASLIADNSITGP